MSSSTSAQAGISDLGAMSAAGTIARTETSLSRRLWLMLEMAVVFIAAPLAMHRAVHSEHVPLFIALLPVLALALILLGADSTFRLRTELRRGFGWRTALTILAVFGIGGGAVAWWVHTHHPGWFLEFPITRPHLYQRIMLLYPLMSVAAQELVYRTFYFHRYGPLFGNLIWLGILVNALLFGFGHIVIGTWFAIITTSATGLLFAVRYATSRSYWAVFLEHTLWGWLVFTVGLGRFFFTGVPNV